MGLAFYLFTVGLILAVPALLVAAIKTRETTQVAWCAIAVLLSFSWMIVGTFQHDAIGADYTKLRFGLIGLNFGAMLLIATGSLFVKPISSKWLAGAAGVLVCIWAYIGFINLVPPV